MVLLVSKCQTTILYLAFGVNFKFIKPSTKICNHSDILIYIAVNVTFLNFMQALTPKIEQDSFEFNITYIRTNGSNSVCTKHNTPNHKTK